MQVEVDGQENLQVLNGVLYGPPCTLKCFTGLVHSCRNWQCIVSVLIYHNSVETA